MATDLSGHILDHYQLIERIGGGGMGDVFRAIDREAGRTVAVKVLKEHLVDSDEFVHRFAREGKLAMQLGRHPHLVTVHDVGRADGRWYLAMEFLQGQSLSRILRAYPVLPAQYVARYIGQIAAALDFMHGQRPAPVVHRDVKPGNIMIDDTARQATLTDFGLARSLAASRVSLTDQLVGTAPYMAPEQTSGQAGPQADVWSLGVVAFEMLCGRPPFGDDEAVAVLYRAKHERPPSARHLNPTLPPAVETAFATVFAKDPADRLANAGAFANALRLAFAGAGSTSNDVTIEPLPPEPDDRRRSSSVPRGSKSALTPATPATPTSQPVGGPRTHASGSGRPTPRPALTAAQIIGIMCIALAALIGIALLIKVTLDDPLDSAQATAVAVATLAREANAVLATAAVDARGLDVVAAQATADSAGERVAAAQATLAVARRQATETAVAKGERGRPDVQSEPARVAAPTRPPGSDETQAVPVTPALGDGDAGARSAARPLLTLISPATNETAAGCVFFAWSAPPPDVQTIGGYELRLCSERLAGVGCEPNHTLRTTQRTSDAWQPDKPDELRSGQGVWDGSPQTFRWLVRLDDRPDVASAVGVFEWRKGTAPCRVE